MEAMVVVGGEGTKLERGLVKSGVGRFVYFLEKGVGSTRNFLWEGLCLLLAMVDGVMTVKKGY